MLSLLFNCIHVMCIYGGDVFVIKNIALVIYLVLVQSEKFFDVLMSGSVVGWALNWSSRWGGGPIAVITNAVYCAQLVMGCIHICWFALKYISSDIGLLEMLAQVALCAGSARLSCCHVGHG